MIQNVSTDAIPHVSACAIQIVTMSAFGDRLRRAREAAGLSTDTIAERFDVSESGVRHHENGTREPDLETVAKYAVTYRVTTDWLLRGVGPGPGEPASEAIVTFQNVPADRQGQALDVLKTFAKK